MSKGRIKRVLERIRQVLEDRPDPCWACSMNRCFQATWTNLCTCCRSHKH